MLNLKYKDNSLLKLGINKPNKDKVLEHQVKLEIDNLSNSLINMDNNNININTLQIYFNQEIIKQ